MKNAFFKARNMLGQTQAKVTLGVAAAVASVCPTLCYPQTGIPALDALTNLIVNVLKWAGYILLAVGAGMVIKAIIDAQSGQSQPGQVAKALAMVGGGAALLVIDTVLGLLGA